MGGPHRSGHLHSPWRATCAPSRGSRSRDLDLLQTAFSTLLDSIAMHALGRERHRYGSLRLLLSLSYAIAAFIAGVIYDRAGYGAASLVFPVTAVALLILLQAVRDPPRTKLGARAVAPATPPGGAQLGGPNETVEPRHWVRLSVPGLEFNGAALRARPARWARLRQSCWQA